MGTLFEEFQILCMYLMSPLFCEKGGTLYKGGHYLRKYGMQTWFDAQLDQESLNGIYAGRSSRKEGLSFLIPCYKVEKK